MIKDKNNSAHYFWGENCEGWRLLDETELSIIEEEMPPNTSEEIHFHKYAKQLFYIKSGIASFEIENKIYTVAAGQSICIKPGSVHRIVNNTKQKLNFLVISNPSTKGDRYCPADSVSFWGEIDFIVLFKY